MDEHKGAEGFALLVLEFQARPLQVGGQMGPPALPGTHLLTVAEGAGFASRQGGRDYSWGALTWPAEV